MLKESSYVKYSKQVVKDVALAGSSMCLEEKCIDKEGQGEW